MTKFFMSAVLLIASFPVLGAPKSAAKKPVTAPVVVSVRAEALKENKSIDEKAYRKSLQASDAQQANVAAFLKLQDPTPELRDRPWLWTFAFKMQQLQPLGTGKAANYNFALDSYGVGTMPSLEFGFLVNVIEAKRASWTTGLSAHAGYMSQKTNLVAPNGYTLDNTRLATTLVSSVLNNRFKTTYIPKMALLVNPELGFVNYTQTNSSSTIANFSQQNTYWGVGLGAEYSFTSKWAIVAQYSYRNAETKKAEISSLQKDNLEIGTQVTW